MMKLKLVASLCKGLTVDLTCTGVYFSIFVLFPLVNSAILGYYDVTSKADWLHHIMMSQTRLSGSAMR